MIKYKAKAIDPTTRPKTASDSANCRLISGRVEIPSNNITPFESEEG